MRSEPNPWVRCFQTPAHRGGVIIAAQKLAALPRPGKPRLTLGAGAGKVLPTCPSSAATPHSLGQDVPAVRIFQAEHKGGDRRASPLHPYCLHSTRNVSAATDGAMVKE